MNSGGCGMGKHRMGVDVQEAMPFEQVLTPDVGDDPEGLLDLGVGALGVDPEQGHLLGGRPTPGPEVEPASRQDVEHGRPLGHPDGVVVLERHADNPVADTDALGLGGHVGQEDLRRAHVGVPTKGVMLDRPDAVEAHLLAEHRLIHAVEDVLALPLGRRVVQLRLEDHGEFHGGDPLCLYDYLDYR
jgi:hypothetical protein